MGASFAKSNIHKEPHIQFKSNNNYIGQTKDGMKDGRGILQDDDGNLVYIWEWLNNQKCVKSVLYVNEQFGVKWLQW